MSTVRIVAVTVFCLSLALSSGAPAAAAEPEVPPAISQWFTDDAAQFVISNSAGTTSADANLPDFSKVTRAGIPHRVMAWSKEFTSGQETASPLKPTSTWIAALYDSRGPVGVVSGFLPTGQAQVEGGYSDDSELCSAIDKVADAVVIEDETSGEWFSLRGTTLSPLNSTATFDLPSSASLADFQEIVSSRYASSLEESEGLDAAVGGNGPASDRRPFWYGTNLGVDVGAVIAIVASVTIFAVLLIRVRQRRKRS